MSAAPPAIADSRSPLERDIPQRVMRALFELAPVAIWITDGERIAFANQACATLFGAASPEALVGHPVAALLAQGSRERVAARIAQTQQTQGPVITGNETIARLDGSAREVQIALSALPDHGATTVQMVLADITEQAQARAELERTQAELRRLQAGLVDAREAERRRIARELHDELGQRLTALKMDIALMRELDDAAERRSRGTAMMAMVDETVAAVRRLSADLRPPMLDDLGLPSALEWLAHGWATRMGVPVELALAPEHGVLPEGLAIALYRMVQEALTNVARHARASRVRIELARADGMLHLTVHDNGIGLPEGAMGRSGSLGLMGMRERAHSLGGQMDVAGLPGSGTRIHVRLPLDGAAAAEG